MPPNRIELESRCRAVTRDLLRIHAQAPGTRVASSLSMTELLVTLFYGGALRCRPADPAWEGRDRLIVSKAHGAVGLYSILADLGFIPRAELETAGRNGARLGSIPDPIIPGFETLNGSLGHGLGVGCGMALGLRARQNPASIVVILGDGELYEGANWEALLFAAHHHLDRLLMILDYNKRAMLGDCETIVRWEPLAEKFTAFGWRTEAVDGHDLGALAARLPALVAERPGMPKCLIAHTIKGRGVPELEADPLCHARSLSPSRVQQLLES